MKINKIYAVLNENRGADTDVTLHTSYEDAKKQFDEIVNDIKQIIIDDGDELNEENFDLNKNHLQYDIDSVSYWGNIKIYEKTI